MAIEQFGPRGVGAAARVREKLFVRLICSNLIPVGAKKCFDILVPFTSPFSSFSSLLLSYELSLQQLLLMQSAVHLEPSLLLEVYLQFSPFPFPSYALLPC